MKYRMLGLALVGALFAVTAAAQEPSDSVKWVGTGKLEIKSTVIASDGCYSAGSASPAILQDRRQSRTPSW